MARKTNTVWTCERCGRRATTEGTEQPPYWSRVFLANPPEHADKDSLGDLCDPCAALLVSFVQGEDEQQRDRDRALADVLERLHAMESSYEGQRS